MVSCCTLWATLQMALFIESRTGGNDSFNTSILEDKPYWVIEDFVLKDKLFIQNIHLDVLD